MRRYNKVNLLKIKSIIQGIRNDYPMSDESIQKLAIHFTEHCYPKHYQLTQAGMPSHSVYFIEQGCTRTFLLMNDKEVTNWFSQEGDITFSSNALYHRTPGVEFVELLEDSILYAIPIDTLDKLYKTEIEMANWSRVIHQKVLLKMQTLRIDRLSLSAKERYEKFVAENPALVNRVNLGYIASYLGISQPYLSNLRAEARF